jgi:cyclophilin family peptidyl-prolyl cis-trans isomerase
LTVGTAILTGETLTLMRLNPSETVPLDGAVRLDLDAYFQAFPGRGPVATFHFRLPVQDGFREITVSDSQTATIMTYELAGGGTYDDFWAVHPDDYTWVNHSIQYELLADSAPISVANFATYANDGAYVDTIIHRSQIDVLQGGGWIHKVQDGFFLDWVPTRPPIPLEQSIANTAGTLAMARQSQPDTATSQFFINVADNSDVFSEINDNYYTVFGRLVDLGTALPLLLEMQDATTWNYGGAFSALPLFAGVLEDKDSWIHFSNITISQGSPEGITLGWSFIDTDGEAGFSQRELANQAAFTITIEGRQLVIQRSDSGTARIRVSAAYGNQTTSFEMDLTGYNPEGLDAFPDATIHQGGFIESPWYGWLVAEEFPFIQHLNHGYQYLVQVPNEPPQSDDFYIYDFSLGSWLYSNEIVYPFIYAYALDGWIWYFPGTGSGGGGDRYFYNYATNEWFTG